MTRQIFTTTLWVVFLTFTSFVSTAITPKTGTVSGLVYDAS